MNKKLGLVVAVAGALVLGAEAFTVGFVDDCGDDATKVSQDYVDAVATQGAQTAVIEWTDDASAIAQAVAAVDLVFLTGGEDVDPSRYGAERTPRCHTSNLKRDAFEFAVLDAATAAHKPVFGICRGLQMINVYHGGTLYQDLATEVGADHASLHNIQLANDGFLKPIFRTSIQSVNSSHHQGVKRLAPGFTVAATAYDGVPEAIENKALNIRGVQFHPERLQAGNELFQRLFRWLVTGELPPEPQPAGTGTLVAKWDFRNYDPANPKSTAVLASALPGGSAAVPCYYKGAGSTPTADLGAMYIVDHTSTECPGLAKGEYAIAIPKYSHLKLPTPDSIKNHAWSMRMKLYRPIDDATRATIFSNVLANNADATLFIQGAKFCVLGKSSAPFNRLCGGKRVDGFRWHELVINADANGNQIYLDGDPAAATVADTSTVFNNGGILLSGDNDGEDNLLYFSEVSIYDGFTSPTKAVADNVTLAADADWRSEGTVTLAAGKTIDLAGHQLSVSSLRSGKLQPVAQWNFNNYDSSAPKSTNVLASAIAGGAAAIPCQNKSTSGSTRGTKTITDGTIGSMNVSATGRFPGEYQITIPVNYHLMLPVPDSVKNHAWAMAIVFKHTKNANYAHTFFSTDLANTSDGSLFIRGNSDATVGASKGLFSPYGTVGVETTSGIQELLVVGGTWGNKAYVNGVEVHATTTDSSKMFNNGAILLCADNDGEDRELDIIDVRIYDTDQVLASYSCGAADGCRGYSTVTDSVGGGELHLDIAEGDACCNHGVQFAGNVKVVKEGDGIWCDCTPHSHSGDTYVAGGTYRIERNVTPFGATGSSVRVASGAVLDVCGQRDLCNYQFEFAGGILANSITLSEANAQLAAVKLFADSLFNLGGDFGLIGSLYAATTLDLGGYDLGVHTKRGIRLQLVNTTATAGKLTLFHDGACRLGVEGKGVVDLSAVTVENFGAACYTYTPTTVGTWIARNVNGGADGGSATITVNDRLVIGDFANGTSKIHTMQLADGAVLDLSELDEAWIPISKFTSVTDYITFAEGAKITVDLGERSPLAISQQVDPYVVKWGTTTPPAAATQFELQGPLGLKISRDATGLRVVRCNTMMIFR